jgi:hypothetical protein
MLPSSLHPLHFCVFSAFFASRKLSGGANAFLSGERERTLAIPMLLELAMAQKTQKCSGCKEEGGPLN